MEISQKGLDLIKSFEGCRLTSYQDAGGVWTIGYGHTGNVAPFTAITQQQADAFLRYDLRNAEKYVNKYNNVYHFTQGQFDALVSFTYNAGAGNLKKLLNGGNKPIELVKLDLPETCIRAKGKVLKGLIRRREAEANLMGDYKKDTETIVYEVIARMWGDGAERKKRLTDAGYDYRTIQDEVNKRVKK